MPSPPAVRTSNAFDPLRLALAALVVYTHARLIGGFGDDWFQHACKGQTVPGSLAVLGFFGLSGFLVSQSFIAANHWLTFVRHRALRILPGFYFALIFTAFVASPTIAALRHADWHAGSALHFLLRNADLRIRRWTIGSELNGLPYNASLNGALWSLFSETGCYGLVLVLGLTGALTRRPAELLLVTGLAFVANTLLELPQAVGTPVLPSFFALTGDAPYVLAFLVGTCCHTFRSHLSFGRAGAILCGLLTVAALKFGGWMIAGPVIFPLFILHLGNSFSFRLKADFSYGLYIFHFPCQQMMVAAGWNQWGFPAFLLTSFAVSAVLAAVSCFAVERPALRFK